MDFHKQMKTGGLSTTTVHCVPTGTRRRDNGKLGFFPISLT